MLHTLLSWEPHPQGEAGPCCTLKRKRCELKCEFRPEDLCDLLIYYVPKHHRRCEFGWASSFQKDRRALWAAGAGPARGSQRTPRGSRAAGQHPASDSGQLQGPKDRVGPPPKGFILSPTSTPAETLRPKTMVGRGPLGGNEVMGGGLTNGISPLLRRAPREHLTLLL